VTPGRIPQALLDFAEGGLQRLLKEPGALSRALGEYLSEPKAQVHFELGQEWDGVSALELDARSCMLYDDRQVFLNGESWRAAGRDASMLRQLADSRHLTAAQLRRASPELLDLLDQWVADGWLQVAADAPH
jgi:50S ribosomal protein L16 3-hydroxylase